MRVRHSSIAGLVAVLLVACSSSNGAPSTGLDGGVDAAPRAACIPLGQACTSPDACDSGACQPSVDASATVRGLDDSGVLLSTVFPGGACTVHTLLPEGATGACNPDAPDGEQGCGACGVCERIDTTNGPRVICRASCEPKAATSGCDREGYTCDFADHACVEGCVRDVECRIALEDVNDDGTPDMNVYDSASTATCDKATGRCRNPTVVEKPSGTPCSKTSECGGDSFCIPPYSWSGGYCSKFGCELEGRPCPGASSICYDDGHKSRLCAQSCVVGAEFGKPYQIGPKGHGEGCREGYRCAWTGAVASQGPNGACVPGNYNAKTQSNLGRSCTGDGDCYSPFGYGRCLGTESSGPNDPGFCTILGCGADGLPPDVCGANASGVANQCAALEANVRFCVQSCSTAADCELGFGCIDYDDRPDTARVCFPSCTESGDCRPSETCNTDAATGASRCAL